MFQAIVSQMIAKGSFRFIIAWIYLTGNNKIGIGTDAKTVFISVPEPSSTQYTCKCHFADAFRERHYSGYAVRGWTPDEYTYFERGSFLICFALMYANAPMYLVMQANFFVGFIFIAGELNAVHSEVGIHDARLIHIFCINLWHG